LVTASEERRAALRAMASGADRAGADRAGADRAGAMLLTLSGWTGARIAQAFGLREDTVRLWRSDVMAGGIAALARRVAAGPAPVKAQAALRVATPLLDAPVEDRPNWTLARLAEEIKTRDGVSISRSQRSKVLRKKGGSVSRGPATA